MSESMSEILNPALSHTHSNFPHAPQGWNPGVAESIAFEYGLPMNNDRWEIVRALQEYFDRNHQPHAREIHDALEEKFHSKGGLKYVYQMVPGGPIAQGCKLAGLEPPAGSVNTSFGSVR